LKNDRFRPAALRYANQRDPGTWPLGAYALIAGHGGAVLHDPDTYLHLTVGRWIIAHGAVPHHGIFSGTMAQAPWVAHEWLGEALLASLFETFGWAGLAVTTCLCAAAALAMLLRQLLPTSCRCMRLLPRCLHSRWSFRMYWRAPIFSLCRSWSPGWRGWCGRAARTGRQRLGSPY
jgi:hypothetical protein